MLPRLNLRTFINSHMHKYELTFLSIILLQLHEAAEQVNNVTRKLLPKRPVGGVVVKIHVQVVEYLLLYRASFDFTNN